MIVSHAGGYCFKLSAGETSLAINPPSPKSAFKVPKFGADVVLISTTDPDWDGVETATHGDKEPFVVRGPGSYEVGDVVVTGYGTDDFKNTVYLLELDSMNVLVLGALQSGKLTQEMKEEIDEIHIIFVPVGEGTLDAKTAHDLVVSLEPSLIIPYQVGEGLPAGRQGDDLKQFLKAEGATDVKPVDKLTLKLKDVAAMDGDVAILA